MKHIIFIVQRMTVVRRILIVITIHLIYSIFSERKLYPACMYWGEGFPLPAYAERLPATQIAASMKMTRGIHSMASCQACFHTETAILIQQKHLINTSKQDARITLWVEEWNALGERSTEWRERVIIPNEHLASGTDEPWSTWRSLNRLRMMKGRCRAMTKMWKLHHTDVCDYGERQTMSQLMTCGDAPNCKWTYLAMPTLAAVNCTKHWKESI